MIYTDAPTPRRGLKWATDSFFNIVTLARWQMRQVWHMFALVALGMVAAALMVGTVPLLTQVNLTANARSVFAKSGLDTTSRVDFSLSTLNTPDIQTTVQQLQQDYKQHGTPFFVEPPEAVLHLDNMPIYPPNSTDALPSHALSLHGYDLGQIASHLKLLQGRLPQSMSKGLELEVALTQDNAMNLDAHLGSIYTIDSTLTDPQTKPSQSTVVPITLRVVGILQDVSPIEEYGRFWHGDALDLIQPLNSSVNNMLVSNPALFSIFTQLNQRHPGNILSLGGNESMDVFFPLDIQAITSTNISQLSTTLTNLSNDEPARVSNERVSSDVSLAALHTLTIDNTPLLFLDQQIKSQTTVEQIPTLTVLALMVGLLLLFIAFMAELLVTRQAEAIAVMRSRGATLWQVFLAFVGQSLLLGLLTVVASALLVPLIIRVLVFAFLPAFSQQALDVLPTMPWATLSALGWYPWIAAALATLTMIVGAWRALRNSMLEQRATQSAGAQRPFWQRIYADVILALLGLLTYGLYTYLTSLNVLDTQTQIVLAGPCMIVSATLLCLAGSLLFLRLFPLLVRLGASTTRSRRGLIPYLPMVIMARAPRHAIRSALLLTFTLIFALFAQIFFATQQQQVVDLATYLAPSDISGFLLNDPTKPLTQETFAQQQTQYQHIPGVRAAALAFSDQWIMTNQNSAASAGASVLTLIATDPSSFGQVINWPAVDHQQQVQTLLGQLVKQRAALLRASADTNATPPAVPALLSAATAHRLQVSVGAMFTLNDGNTGVPTTFVDIGEIPYLPGLADIGTDQGFLVDYTSFAAAYTSSTPGASASPTTIWIRTQPGATLRILPALMSGPLALSDNIIVHQTMLNNLRDDPLMLNLFCLLILGLGLALLLAWVGCLVSAWLSVRARLRGLLALRALGTPPRQLSWLLAWEQAIIFATALILGIAGGAGFTALALPNTVISSVIQVNASADIFQSQFIPLVPVLPATLWLSLDVLILLCAATIGLIGTVVARLSPAQMLRLSADYVEEASLTTAQSQKGEQQTQVKTALAHRRLILWSEVNLARALTPVRRSLGILGLAQVGILFAILFASIVPLFSQVAATAGLQTLLAQPASRYVSVTNTSTDAIPFGKVRTAFARATATLNQAVSTQAGVYVQAEPIIALNTGQIAFPVTSGDAPTYHSPLHLTLSFAALSAAHLPGQIKLLQGRLPQPDKVLQVLLTPQVAAALHVTVGNLLTQATGYPIPLRVVGLFQPRSNTSAFIPASFFSAGNPAQQINPSVTVLTSVEALGPALDVAKPPQTFTYGSLSATITWLYPLKRAATSTQLTDLIAALSSLHTSTMSAQPDRLTFSAFTTPVVAFQHYQQRVEVSTIPIFCLSLLILALLLLFLSFMVDLLVERETNTIATLRSRGATRWQIYRAFLKRTLAMSGLGLLGALVLALPVLFLLTHLTLLPADQQAGLRLLTDQPGHCALLVLGWVLIGTLVTCVGTGLTLIPATRTDLLSLRREAARATRKSYWQRWYLDGVVMVLALAAYGYTLYLSNAEVFSPQLTVEVKAPLALAATLCFVLGCLLFFLRLFPLLLRLGVRQAGRAQGVERMLALAQMARAPRQRLRTALLLLLTTAFVVFVLSFAASQNQHLSAVAQYWAGADFSGSPFSGLTAAQVRAYTRLPGVTAVAAGHVDTLNTGESTVNVIDVDLPSFLRTVAWPGVSVDQAHTLIAEINSKNFSQFPDLARAALNAGYVTPTIIDQQAARALQLSRGQVVTINEQNFLVVAVVPTIPTINDLSSSFSEANAGGVVGGMLVDYQAANAYYHIQQAQTMVSGKTHTLSNLSLNYVWLKTDGSAQSMQQVRHILTTGTLSLASFYDREANFQALSDNPLERDLTGILALGAFVPLLLAWIACLLASWIDVRQRQLLLGVLRALGTTPRQLTKVLVWEQGLIFGAAILLGTLFGLLTAFLALPSLVLTSALPQLSSSAGQSIASSVQDLFALQDTPTTHLVLPPTLLVAVALLALLGVLAVLLMSRSALRLSLGQMLRLNED